jgi:hypothetical protein
MPREMGYADDVVHLHLQSATHWDSLCHIFHRGKMYNGYPADSFTSAGSATNGAEALKDTIVGRGVLLDIPAVSHSRAGLYGPAPGRDVRLRVAGGRVPNGHPQSRQQQLRLQLRRPVHS